MNFISLCKLEAVVQNDALPLPPLGLTQRGQASVTLQPDSGLFNSLGAGVVKLTV